MAYKSFNAPAPTTAGIVKVTTGTAIKTMGQWSTPSTTMMRIIGWGWETDAAPATTGVGLWELLQTDVAATVTAHVAAGVPNMDPNGTASKLTLGTANTGYTASAEGTTTASRVFDSMLVSGVSNGSSTRAYRQFMPSEMPIVAVSKFLRIRCTYSAATNALCYVVWDEI